MAKTKWSAAETQSLALEIIDEQLISLQIAKAKVQVAKSGDEVAKALPWYVKKEFEEELEEEDDE